MFPCTQCGVCCQNIKNIPELSEFDLGNGICKYFDFTNKTCEIYDNRPNICRIDKMFELEYYQYFSKKEFYIENAKACNKLQEMANIDYSYRIKIEE